MEVVFFVILMAFRLATLKLGVPPLAVDLPPDSVLCPEKMISKSSCHLLRMLGKACSMKLSRDDFPAHAVVLAAVPSARLLLRGISQITLRAPALEPPQATSMAGRQDEPMRATSVIAMLVVEIPR